MNEDGKWVTINGRKVFIKDKATNEYMNNKIRNSNVKKQFTEKDMKPRYEMNKGEFITGYELNGIWLLKNDYQTEPWASVKEDKNFRPYRWVINETSDKVPASSFNGVEWVKYNADDKVTYCYTFKEGKEKLIELANKKRNKE